MASRRAQQTTYWSVVHEKFLPIPNLSCNFSAMQINRPLVSPKGSDSGLHVQLHPLVVLSVSDQVTRHLARQQTGPVIGALLGQQNGREITLEHVFECPVTVDAADQIILPAAWFEERLQQFKDVHKDPALDLVGWWSIAPETGPTYAHLALHQQILQDYNQSAIFLTFHSSYTGASDSRGAKVPMSIYESVYEGEAPELDKNMQVDGEEFPLRFREIPYSVETGEAEMIGIDTIVQTSGDASLTEAQGSAKGKKDKQTAENELTQEELEMIGSFRTRINAVRTLKSRIAFIDEYLGNYEALGNSSGGFKSGKAPASTHELLRETKSLLSHGSLLSPAEDSSFNAEMTAQSNDVQLISLLGQLGEGVKSMRDLGRKTATVQASQQAANARQDPRSVMQRMNQDFFAQGEHVGDESGMW
ncbi:unnamed protein product [Penicillium salamii]|nr:unnamed protein product [Penicillium salamii]